MELKDLLKEQLKTNTKLKLMEELEISYRTLQRAIEGETIRKDIYDKIMDRLNEKSKLKSLDDYVEEKIRKKDSSINLSMELLR